MSAVFDAEHLSSGVRNIQNTYFKCITNLEPAVLYDA